MNSAIIVMTILGCGQGDTACNYIRQVETRFESVAACEAETEAELKRTGQVDYPEVIAVCQPPRIETVAIDDLPGPSLRRSPGSVLKAAREATVVSDAAVQAKSMNPLRWTINTTRQLAVGVKRLAGAAVDGLMRPFRQASTDSAGTGVVSAQE